MANSEFDKDQLFGSTVEQKDAQDYQAQRSNLAEHIRQRHGIDPETIIEGETQAPISITGKRIGSSGVMIPEIELGISRLSSKLLIPSYGSHEAAKLALKIVKTRQDRKTLRKAA